MGMKNASLILTDIEFCGWLKKATTGDAIEYHRGFLGADRTPYGQTMSPESRAALICTSNRAFKLAERGLVHLVQRRLAPGAFSYLAIARSHSKNAPLSFTPVMSEEAA